MYDLIIIGGGPAGITAAIYAARYKLNFILITESLGGWLNQIHKIENYPGFASISGFEMLEKLKDQLKFLNATIIYENATSLNLAKNNNSGKNLFELETHNGKIYKSKTVIISSGSQKQKLNILGEKEFLGQGVSYCAICDAPFFKGKNVAVVGGGNSALSAALLLSKSANLVYLIHRRDNFRADKILVDDIKGNKKIKFLLNNNILKIKGEEKVKSIELTKKYNGKKEVMVDGVFIEIGTIPLISFAEKIGIKLDKAKQIKINQYCSTCIKGLFAAGDITNGQGELKQIITASSSGAIAATSVNKYLRDKQ